MLNRVTDADRRKFCTISTRLRTTPRKFGVERRSGATGTERLKELMATMGKNWQIEWKNKPTSTSQTP